jgi:hypothetical protein
MRCRRRRRRRRRRHAAETDSRVWAAMGWLLGSVTNAVFSSEDVSERIAYIVDFLTKS